MISDIRTHMLANDAYTYGKRIAPIAAVIDKFLAGRQCHRLNDKEYATLMEWLRAYEASRVLYGVNFSRIQVRDIIASYADGDILEFEALGPYLSDYVAHDGVMSLGVLTQEDRIGLSVSATLRSLFPAARLVSLYDEYNGGKLNQGSLSKFSGVYADDTKERFRMSLLSLLQDVGAIQQSAVEGEDFILLAESQRIADAEKLVEHLAAIGHIERKGGEIVFVNNKAENPLYRRIRLRARTGKWICEALDAASFLRRENQQITHVVVLPEYMKAQQDRVWEILRVLGIHPRKYHNIFFDPSVPASIICDTIETAFRTASIE